MVSRSAAPLTQSTFRRDVKLFVAVLAAFFAALVLLLILVLHTNLRHMRELIWTRDAAAADAAAVEIRRIMQNDSDASTQLLMLASRFGFAGIEISLRDGRTFETGFRGLSDPVERNLGFGTARFYFDDSAYQSLERRFWLTAIISISATAIVLALLLLYVRRILRPIDAMLDDARTLGGDPQDRDEASYLIETFRSSIATLKAQEAELKTLHEREKMRADDLQVITSTLTRSLGSGLIAFGPNDDVVEMNGAAREILDIPADAAVSQRPIRELAGDNAFADVLAGSVARRERLSRHELEIAGAGERPKVIGLTTVPLFNEPGRFLGTLALFTELTEVRRLEWRIREMQTLADLGVISAGIAHEFRNSLSTILGYLKLASRQEVPPEVAKKITAAETEANQLASAVSSLLQFAGPMRLQFGEVDLRELMQGLAARLRESTPDVDFALDAEAARVAGDRALLSRAFENILRNAAEAVCDGEPPRRVSISVRGGGRPCVTIADSGPGIAPEDAAKVFLPLYSTKANGVGIGLPLARKVILLHGGAVQFESRRGSGTTVHVEFDPEALRRESAAAASAR